MKCDDKGLGYPSFFDFRKIGKSKIIGFVITKPVLAFAGLENLQREWLGSGATALGAVVVPMVWKDIGYHMLLLYSSAKSISTEIYDAAKVDGATKWQISTKIIVPMAIPMMKACVIFTVIGSLKSFDLIYVLTNGSPVSTAMVSSLKMYRGVFTTNEDRYASAIAIFIIVECLLFTFVIQKGFQILQKKKGGNMARTKTKHKSVNTVMVIKMIVLSIIAFVQLFP